MSACLNGGSANGTTCSCPAGTGGASCSALTCGNSLESSSQRPLLSNARATGCDGTGQCSSGFSGLNCNVCTSAQACSAALPSSDSSSSSASTSLAQTNATVVCASDAYTYSQSFLNCGVENPTLQAVYNGTTTLVVERTANASLALASQTLQSGTLIAQLWYSPNASAAPIEQFYCSASSCTQTNKTSTVDYSCSTLSCTCIATAAFCGGPGSVINIGSTVDGLTGPLDIECSTSGDGQCYFKQSVLQSLFGSNGLGLSGCRSGECVRQGVIDSTRSINAPAPGNSLSGGVIAGLAVLGAVILAAALLLLLGKLRQRKARRGLLYDSAPLIHPPAVGLHWQNIGYTLPSATQRSRFRQAIAARRRSHAAGKVVLGDVSGSASAGSLMAILGPSGAGKSTLIDILAGKRKVGRVSGTVSVTNGKESDVDVPARISYVDQEDVLPATSTVREALMFAAELKLPETVSKAEKRDRVDAVLHQLRLEGVAESRIGSSERRGISGGERRRLSIGIELLSSPSILLLDEPTSGLDAVSAMRVVEVLRDLARGPSEKDVGGPRTTVIAAIHQPSSQIIYAFDNVSVLAAGGRQIYCGPVCDADRYFSAYGQPCPAGYNIADHLLELASFEDRLPVHSSSSDLSRVAKTESLETIHVSTGLRRRNARPVTTMMTQFEVVALRDWRELRRDLWLFGAQIGAAIAVGLVVGGMFWDQSDSIAGFQNKVGSLFFLGALLAFWAMSALSNLAKHKQLFLRERASSLYNAWVWLISRALFDMVPLRIIPTIIVATIVYWMSGLHRAAAEFFKYLLIAVLFAIAEALWNLLLAAAIPNLGIALLVSALLNLFQLAFAGFFLNINSVPGCLKWLQWLDPLRYALEATTVNEVNTGLLIQDKIAGVPVQISALTIMELLFSFDPTAYYRDVLVLFGWLAGFLILLILVVEFVLKEVR